MHKTRSELPKEWPLARRGNVYFTVGNHDTGKGIPVIMVLRDILKIVKTRKEARYMILKGDVKVNQKVRKDGKFPLCLFDILTVEKLKKNYRLVIAGKKFGIQEISDKDSWKKIVKIIGKKKINQQTIQINLADGKNFLAKESCIVGDSAVVNFKDNKLEKIVPLKEGAKVLIVSGKHSGKEGKVKELVMKGTETEFLIKFDEGESVLRSKSILVQD